MKKIIIYAKKKENMAYNQEKKYSFSIEIDPMITQLLNLENKDSKAAIINMFMDLKKFSI